jgi:hypothetical protein
MRIHASRRDFIAALSGVVAWPLAIIFVAAWSSALAESAQRQGLTAETCPQADRGWTAQGVRADKAAPSSGCKSHPTAAPAASDRSSCRGDEIGEAFGMCVTNW